MAAPARSYSLFLDLGDVFTKGDAVGGRRLRYPSVIAHRLLRDGSEMSELLLEGGASFPEVEGLHSEAHPRTRSYPGSEAVLRRAEPVGGARFTGWLATKYGAGRKWLGVEPSVDHIDALVRKALLMTGAGYAEVDVILVIDTGPKADAIRRYAADAQAKVAMNAWKFGRSEPRQVNLAVRYRVVDAADCALAALAPEITLASVRRLLLVDIGYVRTKLTIVSEQGCEAQEELRDLGGSDCVRRVLRDGQEQGLVEDEFAVIRGLERSQRVVEVAGRKFDIAAAFGDARRALADEVFRSIERTLLQHFHRTGEMCRTVAVTGGGAAMLGRPFAARLTSSDLGLDVARITDEPSFLLTTGARRVCLGP